jgi:hypothetical protein
MIATLVTVKVVVWPLQEEIIAPKSYSRSLILKQGFVICRFRHFFQGNGYLQNPSRNKAIHIPPDWNVYIYNFELLEGAALIELRIL